MLQHELGQSPQISQQINLQFTYKACIIELDYYHSHQIRPKHRTNKVFYRLIDELNFKPD